MAILQSYNLNNNEFKLETEDMQVGYRRTAKMDYNAANNKI